MTVDLSLSKRYRQYTGRKLALVLVSLLLVPIALAVAVSLGTIPISWSEIFRILMGTGTDETARAVILYSRLPQALAAILAGAGLATSGAAMQSVLRNPLSSPFTLGVSSASAFGAAVVLICGSARFSENMDTLSGSIPFGWVTLGAFLSSMVVTGLILLVSGRRHVRPETIILTGVAASAFFSAGIMFLQYVADDRQLTAIVYWTFGDTQRITWPVLGLLAIAIPLGIVYFFTQAWNYNAMLLGEETARGLGINVRRVRTLTMLFASCLTAVLVASLGVIGFVGLVIPHFSRLLVGTDNRFVLPFTAFSGAVLLLSADTAARIVLAPRLLPVSVLTAFIGAPLFLVLLLGRKAH